MVQRIGHLFGTLSQTIIVEFLENGRLSLSECIGQVKAHDDAGEYSEQEIVDNLGVLIKGSYLQRIEFLDEIGPNLGKPEEAQGNKKILGVIYRGTYKDWKEEGTWLEGCY